MQLLRLIQMRGS